MVKKEYAKATINKDLAFLKRCLNRACDKGILKSNPADEVAPLKESEMIKATKVVEPLEIEDMEKFLREAKRVNTIECQINGKVGTRVYGVNADVVVFQLYSGLRIGEVLGLTWKDIDFEKDYIYVREALKNVIDENGNTKRERGTTKTQSSVRWVPLYSVARTILEEQRAQHPNASDDDLVFVNGNGNPIYTRNVNRTIRDMALRCDCGNKDIASHVMRHTFGAYLITKKVDLYIVSQLMGHASIRTTERVYTKLLQSLKDKEAINVFDDLNVE